MSGNLGNLHFQEGNWQDAIDAYKLAITAVELSRSWAKEDDRRQEILEEAIEVYANTIQCYVNLQQYDRALEYAERSRSKQLVDLIASKDLYQDGNIPEKVRTLLQKHEQLQRQIDNIRESDKPQPHITKTDIDAGGRFPRQFALADITRNWRALTKARNEKVAKLEAEKGNIWKQIRKEDPVIAQGIQVAHLEFGQLQQLIGSDRSAILSFYSTKTDTYIFILRQNSIHLHPCPGQGSDNLQQWIQENWLDLYLSDEEKKEKWQQQMPDFLAELANRLNIQQLTDNHLQETDELILIPHQHLHLIPLSALPVGDGQHLGDQYLIRTLASCQILSFCQNRDRLQTAPTYGIVENTKRDLPFSSFEAETVAQLYRVKSDQRLKGNEATAIKYRELLQKVNRVLSSHHAVSRVDDNLESALILADDQITLGELLTPAYRFPDLDEVFLSCCETNVGVAKPTNDILTLNTGFLSAGARGVISTLWSVEDLAACVFSIIYHELRAEGIDRVEAVQKAQQTMKTMTKKQLKKYNKPLEEIFAPKLKAAYERGKSLEAQKSNYVEGSPEYQSCQEAAQKAKEDYDRISKEKDKLEGWLKEACKQEHPFAHPVYWSSFICAGLRD
jgi:CHAT domain-containing protein